MPKFYFHLRDGVDLILDPEGRQLNGAAAIEQEALREARAIISDDAKSGRINLDVRIDVQDEEGTVVHSICFADAVEILPPNRGES
jgi:hypothetical protein